MHAGSGVVTCFLKFWEQSIEYMVRVVTNGLKQFLVSLAPLMRFVNRLLPLVPHCEESDWYNMISYRLQRCFA